MYGMRIVNNYAQSLLAVLKNKQEQDIGIQELIDLSVGTFADKDLCLVINSPVVSFDTKGKILDQVMHEMKLSQIIASFMKILIKNHRFSLLSEIIECCKHIMLSDKGITIVEVRSVKVLDEKDLQVVMSFLEAKLGNKLLVNKVIDNNLIGGVMIKYNSNMIDASVAGAINYVKNSLC